MRTEDFVVIVLTSALELNRLVSFIKPLVDSQETRKPRTDAFQVMAPHLVGKTVLITGSTDSRSLGWTAAKLLAGGDYGFSHIILSGIKEDAGRKAAQELQRSLPQDSPVMISAINLDITDKVSVESAAALISSPVGPLSAYGGRLDVLAVWSCPLKKLQAEDMMYVMKTNVAAVVELTNALLPSLAKSEAPRVVNVSSARGSLSFEAGLPPERTGGMVYNASKAALNMVTVMQSKNLPAFAPKLKVNAATPGHTKTPFNNFTGTRALEEGAAVIVHLATLPEDGPAGQLIGDQAPYSTNGHFAQIPW
ncbi:short-chain dehydrogenase reductase sdr [Moniliophthora roreri MCA 2997]|uniref:Short-chain dehydrogenase reductase sdr n=1 Tax=Moniliophthora roreri (strain MCA 2997) TaxID=1381753 RepID=V2X6Q4_MONRO|nr:short-chain dehydrogenase reductase sdr [Moniliophthora roreri MCA 2997]